MKFFKELLKSIFMGSFLFTTAVSSCGWDEPEYFYYSKSLDILYGELVKQHFVRRYSYYPASYSSDEYNEAEVTETYNLKAWSKYLEVSVQDARAIVYDRNKEKLASQSDAVKAYLSVVEKQEPVANQSGMRWLNKEEKKKQKAENLKLGETVLSEIKTRLKTEKDTFLRQRYSYLLIRTLHYTGQYQEAINAYEQATADIQQPDKEVAIWTSLLYAGALQRSGKRAESAYQFATLLAKTDTKKLQAQLNFSIKTDKEWTDLMTLCKNSDEQALMHFVRALRVNANSLEELKSVYTLAPDSDWFDAMLFRELEYVQFADHVPGNTEFSWLQASRGVNKDVLIDDLQAFADAKTEATKQKLRDRRTLYLARLSQLVDQVRQDKKRKELFLSDYAALYLKHLSAQPITVADVNYLLSAYPKDARLPYVKPLEHLVYLENLGSITPAGETVIANDLTAVEALEKDLYEYDDNEYNNAYKRRTQDIMTYTYAKLEPLYMKAKQPGKAYLSKQRGDISLDKITVKEILALQSLQAKASPNRLEQKMTADFVKSFGEIDYESKQFVPRTDPNELIARKYLRAGSLDQAKAAAEAAKNKLFNTTFDPFTAGRSGNNRVTQKTMPLLEVIETMQALERKAKEKSGDAQAHYQLGTAYYNMTWFGNSPYLVRTKRTTQSWKKGEIDFARAKEYYELTVEQATSRELKIKALYALAKIEENELSIKLAKVSNEYKRYWPLQDKGPSKAFAKKNGFGTYFKQIRDYEDTQYFKDVIKQCASYRYYFSG